VRRWKQQYGGRINDQLRRLGVSVDWTREAFTMDQPRSGLLVFTRRTQCHVYTSWLMTLITWQTNRCGNGSICTII
jgi:valyl-tRNA synthetase